MSDRIQVREGTAAECAFVNEVLALAEICHESDTGRLKFGDGVTAYNDLPYFGSVAQVMGALNFASITTPTPPGGGLDIFSRNIAGRRVLAMMGPSGVDSSLQPALFGNRVYLLSTGGGAVLSFVGGPTHTAAGTVTTPVLSSADFISSIAHTQIQSAASANAVAHQRVAQRMCWRGDQPGFGGWFHRHRFGIRTLSGGGTDKGLFGLVGITTTIAGTVVPADLADFIGVGFNEGETVFSAWTSRATTGQPRTTTTIPVTEGYLYELTTFCGPSDPNNIGWRLDILNPGLENRAEGTFTDTANMPLTSTFLAPHIWLGNGATASLVRLAFSRLYIETDF